MRIASLSPAVTEILCALGRGKDIVCRDQYSDHPEGVLGVPTLRGHVKVDPEELRAFQPELVFTSTIIQAELAKTLRADGCTVIHQDPRTLPDVYESILEFGDLLDVKSSALSLTERMRQGMNIVQKRSRALPRRPNVYIEEWHHPPMASGNWVPDVLKIAGGVSVPFAPRAPSREVRLEEVSAFDPDLIVLSICGAGIHAKKELLTGRPGWDSLRAVREGKLRIIDDSLLNRPGPRLVEGAQRLYGWIFEGLH